MKRKLIFVVAGALLIFFFLIIKNKHYKLSDKDLLIIPYKGNEKLVFRSNTNDTFTMYLAGYERSTTFSSNGLKKEKFDRYNLVYNHELPDKTVRQDFFCLLTAGKNNQVFLGIYLDGVKSRKFRGSISIRTDGSVDFKGKGDSMNKMDDIIMVPNEDSVSGNSDIHKVYWSRSKGLVRFNMADSVYFELINPL